jgi:hypothetical protein
MSLSLAVIVAHHPKIVSPRSGQDGMPAGKRTVNTEPLPGSLATVMSPPIIAFLPQ